MIQAFSAQKKVEREGSQAVRQAGRRVGNQSWSNMITMYMTDWILRHLYIKEKTLKRISTVENYNERA